MAIRINKVYTRTGDRGETALVGGKRVAKDSLRVEAYGAVDELNSIVGLARVFNEEDRESGEGHKFMDEVLCQIQDELFDIGSELATPPEYFQKGMFQVGADEIKRLEKWIDQCQKDLQPLQSFILPGGGPPSGQKGWGAMGSTNMRKAIPLLLFSIRATFAMNNGFVIL